MIRRLWALPLGYHLLALAVVAGVAIGLTRPGVAFFSDEGVAVTQAEILSQTGQWLYEPSPVVSDPEGGARPFQNGDHGTVGSAPYAKHPLYPLLLSHLAGGSGVAAVALSVAGLITAAGFAALIARQIAPDAAGLQRAALWCTGMASPLLFQSGLVVAHTLAAALAAAAVWAACWVCTDVPRRTSLVVAMVGAVLVTCVGAVMLRTEAVFLGPCLAVGVVVGFVRARPWRTITVAAVAAGAGVVARLVDRAWNHSIVGSAVPSLSDNAPPVTGSRVLDQLHGAYATLVQAGYGSTRPEELLLWVGVIVLLLAVLLWRLGRLTTRQLLGLSSITVVVYLLRLVVVPAGPIPGIFLAFPLLGVALLLFDGRSLANPVVRSTVVTAVGVVACVLATQYPNGGGFEWGWRYSSLVIPVIVPALLWGSWCTVRSRRAAPREIKAALACALVLCLLSAAIGVQAQRTAHDGTRALQTSIAAVADAARRDGGLPVVFSWNRMLPQLLYDVFPDYAWVVPANSDLDEYAQRLADAGVDRVILVGPNADGAVDRLRSEGWAVVEKGPDAPYDVVVLGR